MKCTCDNPDECAEINHIARRTMEENYRLRRQIDALTESIHLFANELMKHKSEAKK